MAGLGADPTGDFWPRLLQLCHMLWHVMVLWATLYSLNKSIDADFEHMGSDKILLSDSWPQQWHNRTVSLDTIGGPCKKLFFFHFFLDLEAMALKHFAQAFTFQKPHSDVQIGFFVVAFGSLYMGVSQNGQPPEIDFLLIVHIG